MNDDPIARLRDTGPELEPGLATALTRVPPLVLVPALTALVSDESLRDDPLQGWAPVHAARWLGRVAAAQAAPTLAEVLGETEPGDRLHEACLEALAKLGPAAVIAIVAAWEAELLGALWAATALGSIGARGPSVLNVWRAALAEDPVLAAEAVLAAGDVEARPLVEAARLSADEFERELLDDVLARLI